MRHRHQHPRLEFCQLLGVGRDVEGDANSRPKGGAGVEGKTLPCPDELDRPPAQVFFQVVEQELEGAVAPDHARQDVSRDRLRRGEQHRLDPRLPFAPAQFRRQVGELAVEVGFRARLPRHDGQSP